MVDPEREVRGGARGRASLGTVGMVYALHGSSLQPRCHVPLGPAAHPPDRSRLPRPPALLDPRRRRRLPGGGGGGLRALGARGALCGAACVVVHVECSM